jgi:hypothetical protein
MAGMIMPDRKELLALISAAESPEERARIKRLIKKRAFRKGFFDAITGPAKLLETSKKNRSSNLRPVLQKELVARRRGFAKRRDPIVQRIEAALQGGR